MGRFNSWIEDCCSLLSCNNSSEYNETFKTFDLTEEDLYSRMDELKDYFNKGFEPEDVLTRFED